MIDLLTVVFREELPLLKFQAKSIDNYIDCVDNIYVIVNDSPDVVSLIDKNWWGRHSDNVCVIPAENLASRPDLKGWSSQQLYKLLGSAQAQSDYVMVLDAKTWFVKRLDHNKLFETDKINLIPTVVPEVFKSAAEYTEKIYNIQIPKIIGPAGVPFIFNVTDLNEMISDLEHTLNESFYSFFTRSLKAPPDLTEFILYTGFIIKKYGSLSQRYNNKQYYRIINISHNEANVADILFKKIKSTSTLTISMHRGAYPKLTEQQFDTWCKIIAHYKLSPDSEFTKNQLNTLR